METKDDRPHYQSSGKVDWFRLLLWSPFLLAVCAGVAWCLTRLFTTGWYYRLFVPAVAGLVVGAAVRWLVARGRCRNKILAGFIGGMAGLVAFVGYYYVHMLEVFGAQAAMQMDALVEFIRLRMAIDGLLGRHGVRPNEFMNWIGSGIDLCLMMTLAATLGVTRAARAYCETCRSWMRRTMDMEAPGTARTVSEALATGSLDQVPMPPPFRGKVGQPMALLELEYCAGDSKTGAHCPTYLTLKESYRGPRRKPKVDTLSKQQALTAEELLVLAELFPKFRLATGSVPPIMTAIPAGPGRLPASITREEVCPGASYPFDSRGRYTWTMFLSFVPLLMLAAGAIAVIWARKDPGGQPETVRLLLGALGALLGLAGGFMTWFNVDWLNHLYTYRLTVNAIGQRPDAWVSTDDPQATYVAVVPRKNWGPTMRSTDRGFLLVDQVQRGLVFEGLRERYRIPATAILSCEIESMIAGSSLYAVVLRGYDEKSQSEWEIPFRVGLRGWTKSRGNLRLARAEELQEQIESLVDRGTP
jgi:hypothetical protein